MITKRDFRVAGIFFSSFFILIMTGWLILMGVFEFPEILRKAPLERFTLFQKNQDIIVLAYYIMAITAIIQVYMAIAMYHLTKKGRLLDQVALTSGILAGIFQILGFFRWVILIPMLSTSLSSKEVSSDIIFFLEKYANTYFGMTIGEHLGSFFLGLWLITLTISMLKYKDFDKKLSFLGIISGLTILVSSYENLSGIFNFLGQLTAFIWGLYLVWVLVIAISLFQKKDENTAHKVHWIIWIIGIIFYLANVIPSFL